jgi:Lhr-like helicases
VIEELEVERIVSKRENRISLRRKCFEYYYNNISMIPDERLFAVIHFSTRKRIGTLDETFVFPTSGQEAHLYLRGKAGKPLKSKKIGLWWRKQRTLLRSRHG